MTGKRPRSSRKLRDTIDRVLIHDIKNMGFRLEMLRSNLDEHYGEPEFKRSVQELLAATAEKLDRIVGRWSEPEDAVLIKVALDLNGLVREVAAAPARRGGRESRSSGKLATLSLALGEVPPVWGDPYYLRDALASLVDNALEAAGPAGKVLVRSFSHGEGRSASARTSRSSTTARGCRPTSSGIVSSSPSRPPSPTASAWVSSRPTRSSATTGERSGSAAVRARAR